jgi:hypothetical protein
VPDSYTDAIPALRVATPGKFPLHVTSTDQGYLWEEIAKEHRSADVARSAHWWLEAPLEMETMVKVPFESWPGGERRCSTTVAG